ncbi:hypothetical protein D3C85_1801520 [compost metagenome]
MSCACKRVVSYASKRAESYASMVSEAMEHGFITALLQAFRELGREARDGNGKMGLQNGEV